MVSRLLRRSGVAVGIIVELLNWKADHIYQVGVGQYHQEMDVLREEWPDVIIEGFEAFPAIVKARKDYYPGKLHSVAVVDKKGPVKLHVKRKHKDGSSLFEFVEEDKLRETITVEGDTLDNLKPDGPEGEKILLWLDCEGSELMALQGAERFCKRVEVVNVEMTAYPPGRGWANPFQVHRWLVEHGFVRQWIHTQRTSAGQYDAFYVRRKLFDPRYCCDPYCI
jgi:FkbM family methyltransferase